MDKHKNYHFYKGNSAKMTQCESNSVALTVTSPPYWNAIDYDIHTKDKTAYHRKRDYQQYGKDFEQYLYKITETFSEVLRVTVEGGFCAIVVGTILHNKRHYPTPMLITQRMLDIKPCEGKSWEFHQDIIWNKVTGGVKRAGSFIQHPKAGYYYPNIMTEYILVFRKQGELRRGKQQAMEIDELFTRDIANNIWHIAPVPPNTISHPCPYPEELARRLVMLYSDEGDEVLDPFLGSGQTAIAAVRNNRKAVGYDIEKTYVELAERRLSNLPKVRAFNLVPQVEKVAF